jgi:hypothetical protein
MLPRRALVQSKVKRGEESYLVQPVGQTHKLLIHILLVGIRFVQWAQIKYPPLLFSGECCTQCKKRKPYVKTMNVLYVTL